MSQWEFYVEGWPILIVIPLILLGVVKAVEILAGL